MVTEQRSLGSAWATVAAVICRMCLILGDGRTDGRTGEQVLMPAPPLPRPSVLKGRNLDHCCLCTNHKERDMRPLSYTSLLIFLVNSFQRSSLFAKF